MSEKINEPGKPTTGPAERIADIQSIVPSLKNAMRRARIEDAERSDVVAELRGAELARLEMLAETLEPVYAQLPDDVDIFDAGVMPGERPRLFIDMIGFVEMGDDKRTYRFVQDTRHGRITVVESEKSDKIVDAITDYIARRMLERERALASDRTVEDAAKALLAHGGYQQRGEGGRTAAPRREAVPAQKAAGAASATQPASAPRSRMSWLWDGVEFVALFIGFIVLLIGLAGAAYFAWSMGEGWWISKFFKQG